jgi:biopolymer transport protein TolR
VDEDFTTVGTAALEGYWARAPAMGVEEETVIVSIDARGAVFLGEEEVPFYAIEERLRAHPLLQGDDREVFVQGDEDVPYGQVLRVLAVVRQAGVERVGLVTDPLSSPETP